MKVIRNSVIMDALEYKKRVYLCGNLTRPQPELDFIKDQNIEIGISNYKNYTAELPHYHSKVREFNYVIEGELKVYIFSEHNEYLIHSNELFLIERNTKYIVKAMPDTRVLFTKYPKGHDKVYVELNDKMKRWMEAWENKMQN